VAARVLANTGAADHKLESVPFCSHIRSSVVRHLHLAETHNMVWRLLAKTPAVCTSAGVSGDLLPDNHHRVPVESLEVWRRGRT
jgi:hypothetical protein